MDSTFVPTRGDWNVAENWDPAGVPGPGVDDSAWITGNRTAVVAAGTSAAVFNTYILDPATFENSGLFATHTLSSGGTISALSGTLSAFQFGSGGTLRIDGGTMSTFDSAIAGTVLVTRGTYEIGSNCFINGDSSTPTTINVSGGGFGGHYMEIGFSGTNVHVTVTGGSFGAGEWAMAGGEIDVLGGTVNVGGFFPSMSGGLIRVSGSGSFLFPGPFFLSNGELDIFGGTAEGDLHLSGSAHVVMTSGSARLYSFYSSSPEGTDSVVTVSGGTWDTTDFFYVGYSGNSQFNLKDQGTLIVRSGTVFLASGTSGAIGILNLGTGGKPGTFQAAEIHGGPGAAVLGFNHPGDYTFDPLITGAVIVTNYGGRTILTAASPNVGPVDINGGILALGPGASIASSNGVRVWPEAAFDTTAKGNFVMPAGQLYTFVIDPDGYSTGKVGSGKIVAAGLDINSAQVNFMVYGPAPLAAPAYVLATYSALFGSEFASVGNLPEGYFIDYAFNNGTQIALVCSNQNPIAVNDFAEADQEPITIPVLANDSDPDGDPISVIAVTQGAVGTVAISGSGTAVTYTPGSDFAASSGDRFTYTISDGRGGTASATVTIIRKGSGPIDLGAIDAAPDGTGSPIAGEPPGTTLAKVGIPSIRDNGFKAFAALLRTGSGFYNAILTGTDLRVLVRQNDPAPEVNGNPSSGAAFVSFGDPLIADSGHTAFLAEIAGPGVSNKTRVGLWTDSFGPLAQVARTGFPAPGVANAKLASIESVILADGTGAALLAFTGRLAPGTGGVTGNNDEALWGINAQETSILLREGDPIVLTGSGTGSGGATVIKQFVALGVVRGSPGQGRAAAADSVVAHVYLSNGLEAILLVSPGAAPQIVAIEGETIPALPGADIAGFGAPTLTGSGWVGGMVHLDAPQKNAWAKASTNKSVIKKASSIEAASGSAILVGGSSGDYSQILVREGDPAPGADGVVFGTLGDPVINAQGLAAFGATLAKGQLWQRTGIHSGTPGGVNAKTDGIWWGIPGNVQLLAKQGAPAPGTNSSFEQFISLALPDGGTGPVFVAKLSGPGTPIGLWATTRQGTLVLVAIVGESQSGSIVTAIEVLGVVAGSPAQSRSYDSQGELIYRLTFQDGHQRIVTTLIP